MMRRNRWIYEAVGLVVEFVGIVAKLVVLSGLAWYLSASL